MHTRDRAIKVGIMNLEDFQKRTIAIAKGTYKPKKDEPKIWFSSMKSLAHLLSEENQKLLKLIMETHPQSVKELEDATGRKANNLLRTLRALEGYGFIKLLKGKEGKGRTPLVPQVVYRSAKIELHFAAA